MDRQLELKMDEIEESIKALTNEGKAEFKAWFKEFAESKGIDLQAIATERGIAYPY